MHTIFPKKLQAGDMVRVIAPSFSMTEMTPEMRSASTARLTSLGLRVTFGAHVDEQDITGSSSIASRVADLHDAFRDSEVKAILTVTGGFNSNELLRYIDWDLIKQNPKIVCGFSDITALTNALYVKTGIVGYSGPNYRTLRHASGADYVVAYFKKCLFADEPYHIQPSEQWIDESPHGKVGGDIIQNNGWKILQAGEAEGTSWGGNLSILGLLQGTEYFPNLTDSILFIEDDYESRPVIFNSKLQSLIHTPSFAGVRGILIGRFERASNMTDEHMAHIIKTKKELAHIPIIADIDFGHTGPLITFPIGGTVRIHAKQDAATITVVTH